MLHALCVLFAALPLNSPLQGDTSSTDPFTMAKWEMFKRERFPYRVGFAVAFRKPNSYGLPTDDEARELMPLENEIDRAMSGKKLGFLSLVITTGGMREYVFYSNMPDAVRREIKKMGTRMHGRDIRSYVTADPGWEVYFRFTQ